MKNNLILSDKNVSIREVLSVAHQQKKIRLSSSKVWQKKINRGRELLLDAARSGKIVYGMNTGVGNASKNLLSSDVIEDLQMFLIAQHGCGIGPDLSEVDARAVLSGPFNQFVQRVSPGFGCPFLRPWKSFINSGLVPAIPTFGSVGASGDLTPLSYYAAVLAGQRFVYLNGRKKLPAKR